MESLRRFLKLYRFTRYHASNKCAGSSVRMQSYRYLKTTSFNCINLYNNSVSEIINQFQEKFLTSQDTSPWPKNWNWNRVQNVISDAEKVVGYPAPLFGLKCLLSKEMGTIASLVHRLIGTNHPLLETAKFILNGCRCTPQTQGLIILLISKAAGLPPNTTLDPDLAMISEPLPKQRSLAEIAEMIHTVYFIHGNLLNLNAGSTVYHNQDLQLGNRIATLIGDYLLATACNGLASLRNPKVVEAISQAITSFSESEFLGRRNIHGRVLPYSGISVTDWEERTFAGSGCLLANSCQCALLLANHSEASQKMAHEFGKYVAFAWQASADLQIFTETTTQPSHTNFDLASLPVILHLENNEEILDYIQDHEEAIEDMDFQKLHSIVSSGDGVLKARSMLNLYVDNAVQLLENFEASDATKALSNIIKALR